MTDLPLLNFSRNGSTLTSSALRLSPQILFAIPCLIRSLKIQLALALISLSKPLCIGLRHHPSYRDADRTGQNVVPCITHRLINFVLLWSNCPFLLDHYTDHPVLAQIPMFVYDFFIPYKVDLLTH
jgi:hypothetical protein